MLALIACVGLCVAVVVPLRKRPVLLVVIGLALWVLLPGVAAPLVVGSSAGSLSFHPSAWFVLCSFAVVALDDMRGTAEELARRFVLYLLLGMTAVGAVLVTRSGYDAGALPVVVDQMVAPLFLFFLANVAIAQRPRNAVTMRNALLGLAALESVLALLQYAAGGTIWFTAQYQTNYWFNPETWTRWMGTTDHPLTLSLLLCTAAPLVAGLSRARVQLPLLVLLVLGVLVSQSRTGLAAMSVALLFVLLRARIRTEGKIAIVVLMSLLAVVAWFSPLGESLMARIADDTGSTAARAAAVDFFWAHLSDFAFIGDGITSSYRVSRAAGLASSLESSILMYAVGLGLFFTVIYFGAQAWIVGASAFRRRPPVDLLSGVALSGLVVLLVPQTYSALAAQSLAGTLLWYVLALASADPVLVAADAVDDTDDVAPEDDDPRTGQVVDAARPLSERTWS